MTPDQVVLAAKLIKQRTQCQKILKESWSPIIRAFTRRRLETINEELALLGVRDDQTASEGVTTREPA